MGRQRGGALLVEHLAQLEERFGAPGCTQADLQGDWLRRPLRPHMHKQLHCWWIIWWVEQ